MTKYVIAARENDHYIYTVYESFDKFEPIKLMGTALRAFAPTNADAINEVRSIAASKHNIFHRVPMVKCCVADIQRHAARMQDLQAIFVFDKSRWRITKPNWCNCRDRVYLSGIDNNMKYRRKPYYFCEAYNIPAKKSSKNLKFFAVKALASNKPLRLALANVRRRIKSCFNDNTKVKLYLLEDWLQRHLNEYKVNTVLQWDDTAVCWRDLDVYVADWFYQKNK